MKQFENLEFEDHPSQPWFEKQARMSFENGYGVSVVTGQHAYTSKDKPYEVAVLYNDSVTYDSPLTDDVLGYQSEEDLSEIMKTLQEL